MKSTINEINLDFEYKSFKSAKELKEKFNINIIKSTNEFNIIDGDTYYKNIITSIDINYLIDSYINKNLYDLIKYSTDNTKIIVKKIIPFDIFFNYYDSIHTNELLVYFEFNNKNYFLYLRLTDYQDHNEKMIYPLYFEEIEEKYFILDDNDDNNIKKHIKKFGKKQISIFDEMFLHYSIVNKRKSEDFYFRGMSKEYDFSENKSITINDFISLSKNEDIATNFASKVLYKIKLCKGVPYIDNSKIAIIREDEIILPRNCVLTLKKNISKQYGDKNISLIEVEISYNNEEMKDKLCIKKTIIKLKSSESSKSSELINSSKSSKSSKLNKSSKL